MAPVYEPFYTEVGADLFGTAPEYICYNGPFYMSQWVLENSISCPKNESYWDADKVNLAGIKWVKYTDTNAKFNAFVGGELDVLDLTGEQRAMLEAEGYKPSNYMGGYSYWYWCNVKDTARDVANMNLRKAISAALDRKQIIATVYKNDNEPSSCLAYGISGVNTETFGEAVVAANGGNPLYAPTADLDSAKEYLAKALEELGYKDASEVSLCLMTSEGTQNELLSQVVQEQLRKNLGLNVTIEVLTITEWRARRNSLDFDVCFGGWGPDYNDPNTFLDIWVTDGGNNQTGFSNERYDELIDLAAKETDLEKRESYFIECEQIIADQLPIGPSYWRAPSYACSDKIKGGMHRSTFQDINAVYVKLS